MPLCSLDGGGDAIGGPYLADAAEVSLKHSGHADVQINRCDVAGYHHAPVGKLSLPVGAYDRHRGLLEVVSRENGLAFRTTTKHYRVLSCIVRLAASRAKSVPVRGRRGDLAPRADAD
jgi:hypothetical protein